MKESTIAPCAALQPAFERLEELAGLGPGWDSYGAAPISARAIASVRRLLAAIASEVDDPAGDRVRPYVVVPIANGGVQIEWRGPGGSLEVDVGPAGDLGYLLITGEEPARTFEERDGVAEDELVQVVVAKLKS